MEWVPVEKGPPKKFPTRVLATVMDVHDRKSKPYVADCEYGRKVDFETGEFYGDPSFIVWTERSCLDINNHDPYKVTAWMNMPEPYKSNQFRVIVAGSRQFDNYPLMCEKLDKILKSIPVTSIVCGEAAGADTLGKKYAQEHRIRVDSYPANWEKYKKQAGYLRNEEMAKNAEALVAFWNGTSAGTKHMIETAKKMGLQVRVIKF